MKTDPRLQENEFVNYTPQDPHTHILTSQEGTLAEQLPLAMTQQRVLPKNEFYEWSEKANERVFVKNSAHLAALSLNRDRMGVAKQIARLDPYAEWRNDTLWKRNRDFKTDRSTGLGGSTSSYTVCVRGRSLFHTFFPS